MSNRTEINFGEIKPFKMVINLHQSDDKTGDVVSESHIHEECEIYVNLSGNVSFMVENNIYKVEYGDIIITRPYEYHHCIYHSDDPHNHFWILFSNGGNRDILSRFYNRSMGEDNKISLSDFNKEKLMEICYSLMNEKSEIKKYIYFLNLIELISQKQMVSLTIQLPDDVKRCIDYINVNYQKEIKLKDLSEISFVTVNTLERHFKKHVGISPYEYITNCRLSKAVSVLKEGGNVTQAAEESGFSDYSHFIALFKKRYGKTPLKFKKEL